MPFNRAEAIAQLKIDISELLSTLNSLESPDARRDVASVRQSYADRSSGPGAMERIIAGRPSMTPKARIGRASVRYEMLPVGRGSKARRMTAAEARQHGEAMPAAYRAVWAAIVASKAPLTARELESASGQVKKTVESAVWQLRQTYRLIRSVKA